MKIVFGLLMFYPICVFASLVGGVWGDILFYWCVFCFGSYVLYRTTW